MYTCYGRRHVLYAHAAIRTNRRAFGLTESARYEQQRECLQNNDQARPKSNGWSTQKLYAIAANPHRKPRVHHPECNIEECRAHSSAKTYRHVSAFKSCNLQDRDGHTSIATEIPGSHGGYEEFCLPRCDA
jgi:hypothetical protein